MNPPSVAVTSAPKSSPKIMGILNVTPDSFSDGGLYPSVEAVVQRGKEMVAQGASILDVGGESTRPNAPEVTTQVELGRVIPVIERLAKEVNVGISIDTRKVEVARAAYDSGATWLNDVSGLREREMLEFSPQFERVVIMHMRGIPSTMQSGEINYDDVVTHVSDYLEARVKDFVNVGGNFKSVFVDPGIGFGKTTQHNIELIRRIQAFENLGCAGVVLGASRKRFLGEIAEQELSMKRDPATHALSAILVHSGCAPAFLRVHDVEGTRQAIQVASIFQGGM